MSTPPWPLAGQVIAEKYRVDSVLGSGGMGVVVAATHLQLKTHVAIKLLRHEGRVDEAAVARLLREARATAQIKSTHVPRVSDVGLLDSGSPYVVMELLEGEDLSALLRRTGRLTIRDAVSYLLDACEAVHRAHELGVHHRDLKPSNIFIAREVDAQTCVKVLDFGLSKVGEGNWAESVAGRLTATNAVLGTPLYMSPEQMESATSADARSDVWALGAILHETLAGRPPFAASSLPQLCTLILHGQPVPVSSTRDDVPDRLAEIVTRCLQKDPAKRYQDVRSLAEALAEVGVVPRPGWLSRPSEAPAVSQEARGPDRDGASARRRRSRAGWIALGLVALALVGVALGAGRRESGHRAARPNESPPASDSAALCSTCLSKSCAAELRACQGSPACARAVATYNACVQAASPDRAVICSEELGTSRDVDAQRLASCVFVRTEGTAVVAGSCAEPCSGSTIDDPACVGYCTCMKQTCPGVLDAASCLAGCARLKPDIIHCRSVHCFLAPRGGDVHLHCQHAIGQLGMCD